jgi:predicted nucleotidyltransferase
LGDVKKVYLSGSFARGINSETIDLLIIGEIDIAFMDELCLKIKKKIEKTIKYQVYSDAKQVDKLINNEKISYLLLWEK